MNDNHIRGRLDYLQWESDFFFRPSAKLTLDSAGEKLTREALSAYPLVQVKVPADESDILETLYRLGFRMVEGEIDFSLNLLDGEAFPCEYQVASEADILRVSQLAAGAFQLSRFRAPWYEPDDSGRFYALWAEKAILGTFDTHCLTLLADDGQLLGFVTLRTLEPGVARIGLLAVQPQVTGRGIGKRLMHAAKHWCLAQGVTQLRVATQTGNIAALNLYRASGGVLSHSAYWLYR
ncbi:dTDP-4-amino-4,6-dideoxy-D-galactose acyltransferase [Rouxiella badensis]|jgi:dTDP-4-amino-4,6-dideoxy-D-galactose acyltransferase|uniref:dTDP-fucosamine acetyltransferase n=1 Tax=Rouxiella badensis TaxID=1646377 RepID=A0A1X0WFJ2_9GAMM|nr:dTDP-4-amino-4,6-dideoxy-D-galactose acyltransferase [Rouxiella badensis]MCC3720904.1 dTDP-4-amino-4,6-dideoxy-D-galactose acyltransferase [Rouxiella badensis]MCC3730743.1 dTDP-4-amino-4,6-dideoxy-D-galactose acyltransferase [Rouxiella badensis]MCC3735167.1 dTDP-4-amino-4,6-dideoxy-D-galactose acyltransferase [Rouxiella badensis]MCC3741989.1 dTDP-4-amino-4,6-dideoxy-D-galactose acyltransferase [Rouxiella badensis]MCC3749537.1 dTDP-4-amino-4,6-dideoxy-D-galactose acyltransferase [Rouxiella b